MLDLTTIRSDRQSLLAELQTAGAEIRRDGLEIKCPFHEDDHASAGIYEEGGVFRYKCQAAGCGVGGDVIDIMALVSKRTPAEVLSELARKNAPACRTQEKPHEKQAPIYTTFEKLKEAAAWSAREWGGTVTNTYTYTNPTTNQHDMVVFRIEGEKGKTFRQAHQTNAGYIMRAPTGKWPLYNRARIPSSAAIVIVEGEKCVHALHNIGIVATTSPGGAGKASLADWTPVAGKIVYVWPDNDLPDAKTGRRTGIEHMRQVVEELQIITPPPDVRSIDPDVLDLPPKGDCVDYLAQFGTATCEEKRLAIESVLEFARSTGPAGEVRAEVEAAIAGKRTPIPWPWPTVSKATRALLPGTLTILCGPPGSTKSLWLLEALAYWHERGENIAVLELEENRVYHVMRAIAQRVGVAGMTRGEWQQEHAEEALKIQVQTETFADSFGRVIFSSPLEDLTADMFIAWMKARAEAKARIIVIDPVTAMNAGDKQWVADHRVVVAAHQVATEYNASVILVTHPRKAQRGKEGTGLDDMAGGATYQRFSQTVLWIDSLKEIKTASVIVSCGRTAVEYNRIVKVLKARNSWGQWKHIAFNFDSETFRSKECGLIVED